MNEHKNRTYRTADVCAIANLSPNTLKTWVGKGTLQLSQRKEGGWTSFTFADLIRVCAWAEVNSLGIPPNKAVGLVDRLEDSLADLADSGFKHRDDLTEGLFVVTTVMGPGDDGRVQFRVTTLNRKGVAFQFASGQAERLDQGHSTIVINVGLAWRRIVDAALEAEA